MDRFYRFRLRVVMGRVAPEDERRNFARFPAAEPVHEHDLGMAVPVQVRGRHADGSEPLQVGAPGRVEALLRPPVDVGGRVVGLGGFRVGEDQVDMAVPVEIRRRHRSRGKSRQNGPPPGIESGARSPVECRTRDFRPLIGDLAGQSQVDVTVSVEVPGDHLPDLLGGQAPGPAQAGPFRDLEEQKARGSRIQVGSLGSIGIEEGRSRLPREHDQIVCPVEIEIGGSDQPRVARLQIQLPGAVESRARAPMETQALVLEVVVGKREICPSVAVEVPDGTADGAQGGDGRAPLG